MGRRCTTSFYKDLGFLEQSSRQYMLKQQSSGIVYSMGVESVIFTFPFGSEG